ncbi:MAG: cobalamin B12-binding domain-containing protein [Coriobacteriia bacterium]|nr:cobalamin B12-binding domain-containing protein [Coriobacteriia bacterium]
MDGDGPARLYQAFVDQDPAAAIEVIERARSGGLSQQTLFDSLYAPAMALLGGAWASGAVDEVAFAQAAVVAEQIGSFVIPPASAADTGLTVLIGVMQRDAHSVGKNVIAAALKEAGHRVVDLGVDVRPAEFLERVEETGARIVFVCAETGATARAVARVRDMLTAGGHPDVVLLVSGGPFEADPALARDAGANGVARGAESALRLVSRVGDELLGREG